MFANNFESRAAGSARAPVQTPPAGRLDQKLSTGAFVDKLPFPYLNSLLLTLFFPVPEFRNA
jgi:hypothetical protein